MNTVLVTSTAYTAAGWVDTVTDPRGLVTKTFEDNLGRTTKTVEAYDGGSQTNSILELTLETGRRNQIRVHLSEAGHPVLGDTMYGQRDGFSRLALHARLLGFVHPRTGKKVAFTAELPREFEEVTL